MRYLTLLLNNMLNHNTRLLNLSVGNLCWVSGNGLSSTHKMPYVSVVMALAVSMIAMKTKYFKVEIFVISKFTTKIMKLAPHENYPSK